MLRCSRVGFGRVTANVGSRRVVSWHRSTHTLLRGHHVHRPLLRVNYPTANHLSDKSRFMRIPTRGYCSTNYPSTDIPSQNLSQSPSATENINENQTPPQTNSQKTRPLRLVSENEPRHPRVQELIDKVAAKKNDYGLKFDLVVAIFKTIPENIKDWNRVTEDLTVAVSMLEELASSSKFVKALKDKLNKSFTEAHRSDLRARLVRAEIDATKEPGQVSVQAHLAHMLLLTGEVQKSLLVTKRARNIAESNIYFMKGVECGPPEDGPEVVEQAEKYYTKALEIWPENSAALTNLGVLAYYGRKNKEAAIKFLQQAIKADVAKQNYVAHFQYACLAEVELGDVELAKYHYARAIEIYPRHSFSHSHLGSLLMDEGLYDMAHEHFKLALEYGPKHLLNYYNIANICSKKGMVDAAVNYMKKAIELNPNWPHTYYLLGNIYFNHKMADEAVLQYKRVIELAQQYPEQDYDPVPAINNMVVVLRKRAYTLINNATTQLEYARAAKYLDEALTWANKSNEKATAIEYMNMAYCYMKSRQPDKAIIAIEKGLLTGGPAFADEFMKNKAAEATKVIFEQLEVHMGEGLESTEPNSPDRARAHYNIAFCLFHLGDARAAAEHLKEAVNIDPMCTSDYLDAEAPTGGDFAKQEIAETMERIKRPYKEQPAPQPDEEVEEEEFDDEELKKEELRFKKALAKKLFKRMVLEAMKSKKLKASRKAKAKSKKKKATSAQPPESIPQETTPVTTASTTQQANQESDTLPSEPAKKKKKKTKKKSSEDFTFDDMLEELENELKAGRRPDIVFLDNNNNPIDPAQARETLLQLLRQANTEDLMNRISDEKPGE